MIGFDLLVTRELFKEIYATLLQNYERKKKPLTKSQSVLFKTQQSLIIRTVSVTSLVSTTLNSSASYQNLISGSNILLVLTYLIQRQVIPQQLSRVTRASKQTFSSHMRPILIKKFLRQFKQSLAWRLFKTMVKVRKQGDQNLVTFVRRKQKPNREDAVVKTGARMMTQWDNFIWSYSSSYFCPSCPCSSKGVSQDKDQSSNSKVRLLMHSSVCIK